MIDAIEEADLVMLADEFSVAMDSNRDGVVDRNEFVAGFSQISESVLSKHRLRVEAASIQAIHISNLFSQLPPQARLSDAELEVIWRHYDQDGV